MKILYFFYFCGSFLPSWIRIRNLNADPDPAIQINADPDTDPDPKPCLKEVKVLEEVEVFKEMKVPGLCQGIKRGHGLG
jgi:hypothetical protein